MVQTRHSIPKQSDCLHCGRSFARLEHLQRHVRTHTKEKPFHCPCGKAFARNDLLKRHGLRDHGASSRDTTVPPSPAAVPQIDFHSVGASEQVSEALVTPEMTIGNSTDSTSGVMEQLDADTFPNIFEEFTTFIEYAGLDPSWDSVDLDMLSLPASESENMNAQIPDITIDLHSQRATILEEPIDDEDNFAGLIPYQDGEGSSRPDYPRSTTFTWRVSEAERQVLMRKIAVASYPPCPVIDVPSKQAFSRYFQSYADGFHKHFPMLHLPTFSISKASPELSLAMAAVGAQYRFEFSNGLELYRKARHMAWQRISQCQNHTPLPEAVGPDAISNCGDPENISTIILLIAFSSWMNETDLLSEAVQLQAPLAHALHQDTLSESDERSDRTDWNSWIYAESRHRAKLIGFAYLNVQSLTYNTPPLVFANEIDLLLPCTSAEWEARTPTVWHQLRMASKPAMSFQEGMRYLLSDPANLENLAGQPQTSPLALFVLLQAVLQRIMLARQMQLPGDTEMHASDLDLLESALHSWKSAWRRDPGSTLDPQNIDGPLPFTSVAFLALAFARLHFDISSHRTLESRDPHTMAASLNKLARPNRGPKIFTALLHAVHALSVPVRMGVDYVSRSQMFFWSCMHSICALECGVLVWKWLQRVEMEIGRNDLTPAEAHIVRWLRALVKEALESLEPSDLGLQEDAVEDLTARQLGAAVLHIWSRTLAGNELWPVIRHISNTFDILARQSAVASS